MKKILTIITILLLIVIKAQTKDFNIKPLVFVSTEIGHQYTDDRMYPTLGLGITKKAASKEGANALTKILSKEVKPKSNSDFDEFRKEILNEQKSFMEDIKSMLSNLVVGGVSVQSEDVPTPQIQTLEEEEIVELPEKVSVERAESSIAPPMGDGDGFGDFTIEEVSPTEEGSTSSGDDILASLMGGGNSMVFGGN